MLITWHKEGLYEAGKETGFNRHWLVILGKETKYYNLSRDYKHSPFCLLKSRCDKETGGGNIKPSKTSRVFSQEVSNDCH